MFRFPVPNRRRNILCEQHGLLCFFAVSLSYRQISSFLVLPVSALIGFSFPAIASAQEATIGKLLVSRQVMATRAVVSSTATPGYYPARDGQPVFTGQGIRTLRRARAEIRFLDKSILRISERTDLIVQDTASLRRIQLKEGLVWMRVQKGVATQIETPSATAVARGTEFTVEAFEDGSTLLTVYEGEVALQKDGKEVLVRANEKAFVEASGALPEAASSLSVLERPMESGGSYEGWWNGFDEYLGLGTINGGRDFTELRTSLVGELSQQLTSVGLNGNEDDVLPFYIGDSAARQRFLTITQGTLIADFRQQQLGGLSLDAYRNQFGGQSVNQRLTNLSASDAAFLSEVGVRNIGDFVEAALINGASVSANVTYGSRGRSFYQPGSIEGPRNFDLRLFDRTESNDSLLGIGAATALVANALGKTGFNVSVPKFEFSGFGQGSDETSVFGGRARVTGLIGRTRYRFESNALEVSDETRNNQTQFARLASIAEIEQVLSPQVTLFAGRRRFYHGPVFNNFNLSQLIADRYSAAGLNVRSGAVQVEGAYLHDANPEVRGAQEGALGSVFLRGNGGQYGLHYIYVPELSGKNGLTGSLSYPVWQNKVDFYAEAGQGPDEATLQTYGAYFPGLFQLTETDAFVEYSAHQGLGRSVSFIASRDANKYLNFRAFLTLADFERSGRQTIAGLTTLVRFGN